MAGGGEAAMAEEACTFEGCENPPERNGLCAGHRKQKQRKKPLAPLRPKTARERLQVARDNLEAALHRLEDARAAMEAELEERGSAYANADSEDDRAYRKCRREFYDAVYELARVEFRSRRRR